MKPISQKCILIPLKMVERKSEGSKRKYYYETWLYKCTCGKEKVIRKRSVDEGRVLSCGCIRSLYQPKLPKGEASFNTLFNQGYKARALRKKLEFTLSIEKFRELVTSNCFYCGATPSNIKKQPGHNGEFIYNGIDRVDSSIGYIEENCVSCCATCNKAKLAMSKEEFLLWIEKVYNFSIKEKINV